MKGFLLSSQYVLAVFLLSTYFVLIVLSCLKKPVTSIIRSSSIDFLITKDVTCIWSSTTLSLRITSTQILFSKRFIEPESTSNDLQNLSPPNLYLFIKPIKQFYLFIGFRIDLNIHFHQGLLKQWFTMYLSYLTLLTGEYYVSQTAL